MRKPKPIKVKMKPYLSAQERTEAAERDAAQKDKAKPDKPANKEADPDGV